MTDSRSDAELLAGLRRQPELMGALYARHAPAVFRYLARRAGRPAAEDLLSEVFIAALSASSRVCAHESGSALPWLYGIALNVLRAHFRRQQLAPAPDLPGDFGMDWDAVDERIDARARRGHLRAALAVLSESDRELLLLVGWEGLSMNEAAAALGISPGAARVRLHRARKRAHKALDQLLDDMPGAAVGNGSESRVTTLYANVTTLYGEEKAS